MATVLSFRSRAIEDASRIIVVRLTGDEFDGARPYSYAIFVPLSTKMKFPVLSLIGVGDDLKIEFAAPDRLGVRTGEQQDMLIIGGYIVGCLYAILDNRERLAEVLKTMREMAA